MLDVIVGSVATWRITYMLLYESGPFRVFRVLREKLGVMYDPHDDNRMIGYRWEITTCMYCLSVWVGAAVALLLKWRRWAVWTLLPFVFSAAAIKLGAKD